MNDFPILKGADTMIVLSEHCQYKLHSINIKHCSGRLARLLDRPGPKLSKDAQKIGVRYHLVLQNYSTSSGKEIEPTFRRVELNSQGFPVQAVSIIHESEEVNIDPKLYGYYHTIFASFFGCQLSIDTANMAVAMEETLGLLDCAEYLECTPMISKSVDNALISMGQDLYQTISAAPAEWIDIGYRLSSKVIFKESLIHLTGRYNEFKLKENDDSDNEDGHDDDNNNNAGCNISDLRSPIRKLVEEKHAQLKAKCQDADQKMVTFYPPYLQRHSSTGRADRDDIGRASHANDVFAWMSVSLYRHWLGQAIARGNTHRASDGGYSFYKRVSEAGMAYLDRISVAGFHDRFPMTAKAKSVLTNHLNIIKTQAQTYVKHIVKNESDLDVQKHKVHWLTCIEVGADDYIWERAEQAHDEEEAENSGEDVAEEGSGFDEFGEGGDLDEDVEDQYKYSRRAVRDDMIKSMAVY